MNEKKRLIFISWQPHCSRSDSMASELGGKSFMVYYGMFGSRLETILLKYILQTIKTVLILLKYHPHIVFVMSPPLFACVPVFIYCKIFRKKYIIDAHTGAFTNPMWQKVIWLQKYFAKNACCNIITNHGLSRYLLKWKAPFMIVPDVPIMAKAFVTPNLNRGNNVTLINTFSKDEPLEQFLKAAEHFKNINFYVTGKIKFSDKKYINSAPENVTFTDFLDAEHYYGLMLASDLIVVLTQLDNTMQRGAYEAIYNGKPVLTSNWKVLKKSFGNAAVYVDNNAKDIILGLEKALNSLKVLSGNANEVKKLKLRRWEMNKKLLSAYLNSGVEVLHESKI